MYILSLLLCALRNCLMSVMEHDGGRGARVKQAVITAGKGPVSDGADHSLPHSLLTGTSRSSLSQGFP